MMELFLKSLWMKTCGHTDRPYCKMKTAFKCMNMQVFVTTSAGTLASPGFSSVPCQEKVQHGDGSETIHGNVVEKQNYICDLNLGNLLLYFGPPLTPSTPMSALLRYLQKAFLSPLVGS